MVSWDHGPMLESLLDPRDYDKVMKPDDIRWVKYHLSLARLNPEVDVVEFSKSFMGLEKQDDFVPANNPPTFAEIATKRKKSRVRQLMRGCFCAIQDYCDVCQED
jgi:hypothetical protein